MTWSRAALGVERVAACRRFLRRIPSPPATGGDRGRGRVRRDLDRSAVTPPHRGSVPDLELWCAGQEVCSRRGSAWWEVGGAMWAASAASVA